MEAGWRFIPEFDRLQRQSDIKVKFFSISSLFRNDLGLAVGTGDGDEDEENAKNRLEYTCRMNSIELVNLNSFILLNMIIQPAHVYAHAQPQHHISKYDYHLIIFLSLIMIIIRATIDNTQFTQINQFIHKRVRQRVL